MPNHWESSARPLFVKTVFVNGNRHAILFEKDPHLRCENAHFKKISRSNSSTSFASDLSLTSENQGSGLESKAFRLRNNNQRQRKDLSSDLQSCLVKLRLASDNLDDKNKSNAEKCFCGSKETKRNHSKEKEIFKQKKQKWNHEIYCKKKSCGHFYEEPKEHKLTDIENSRDNSCYVYSLENYKGKKNYCFVKISSQPPQYTLKCSCEKDWNETHNHDPSSKSNVVISATIHNLVMAPIGNENLLENTINYVFPLKNSDFCLNNYITKSFYNCLSDRVLQWLDLARKRKNQNEKLKPSDENNSPNSAERIFSGNTYTDGIKNTEYQFKPENKILVNKKAGKITQNETSEEEEVEREVTGEPNIETLMSTEKAKSESRWSFAGVNSSTKVLNKSALGEGENPLNNEKSTSSVSAASTSSSLACTEDSAKSKLNTPITNLIKSPLKIQDLFLNCHSGERGSSRDENKRKAKEVSGASALQSKHKEASNSEEENDSIVTMLNTWGEKTIKKGVFPNKSVNRNKQPRCHCDRNLDKRTDKSQILTEKFAETNQKSINNLNITQTGPVLIQNLLSPQQHNKISYLREEKIVWASEKDTGRPQLHIFMPSVPLKDPSDDSMSEYENFLNS